MRRSHERLPAASWKSDTNAAALMEFPLDSASPSLSNATRLGLAFNKWDACLLFGPKRTWSRLHITPELQRQSRRKWHFRRLRPSQILELPPGPFGTLRLLE